MAAGARVERDLETTRVLYSAACFDPPGCQTANAEGFPFAGLSISGSRRDRARRGQARGRRPRHAAGIRLADGRPATALRRFGTPSASAASGCWSTGTEALGVSPSCDFRAMAPCGQVSERSAQLGDRLPDGRRTVSVEATDTAGNVTRVDRAVAVDRHGPALAFVPSSSRRRIAVAATDAGSGVTGGTIEARGRRERAFRALPTRLRGGRLVARLARGSRRSTTLRVTASDAVGHRSTLTGAPVRMRAGFGRRRRASQRFGLRARPIVRGSLRSGDGRPLPGREIIVRQRARLDGARFRQVGTVGTGRRGEFRASASRGGRAGCCA